MHKLRGSSRVFLIWSAWIGMLAAVLFGLTAVASASSALYTQAVLADSPLGFWPLDGSSATSAADASGNGNTLSGPGTGVTAGVTGGGPMDGAGGMTFSGGYLGRGYFPYTNNFAMELWARSNRINEREALVSNGWVGTDNCWHGVWAAAQASTVFGIDANTCNSAGGPAVNSVFASQTDWHHILVQRSAGTTTVWIDGEQQSGSDTIPITLNGGSFRVGGLHNGTASASYGPFYGAISEVAYYNHGLSAAQIAAHYNAAVGAPTNTTAPTISPATLIGPGLSLSAATGKWVGAGVSYAYQWRRCDAAGANCADIDGATSRTYVLQSSDAGSTVRVQVTATDSQGSAAASSPPTDLVAVQTPRGFPLYAQTVLGDSPLGFWPLDGSSVTSVPDASGNSNTLSGPGTGITAGVTGPMPGANGMAFSGGYLGRGYFSYTNNFAIEFWARSNRVNEREAIVSNGWVGTDNCWHGVWASAQASTLWATDANTCFSQGGPSGHSVFASQSDWHHIVVQRSAGTTTVWVDGAQQSGTDTTAITLNGGSFRVGGLHNGTANASYGPFYGAISDVAYYNHVLTATQIAGHYSAAIGGPTNTTAPAISPAANLHSFDVVTADHGTWAGTGTITYGYQWQACASPTSCTAIDGASGASYRLTTAEVGKTIRVVVTATNALGSGAATSAPTDAVAGGAPSNTAVPSITGDPLDGQTLTSSVGTWSGDTPISYARQWRRCDASGGGCADIAGATDSAYALTSADVGNTIKVVVTATNSAGSASATSAATSAVSAVAPQNTELPSISGTPSDGETLSSDVGSWSGSTPMAYARQWRRCDANGDDCSAIAGETGATYTLTAEDVGFSIRVAVTASNAAASVSATSGPTDPVSGRAPVNTDPPTIEGTPGEGHTLSASHGTWDGTAPLAYTYRWQRCDEAGSSCADIAGATDAAYVAGSADVGATIRVVVTATNDAGEDTAESAATDIIAPAVQAPLLPGNETTDVSEATSFLYTGSNPIQDGVGPGTISPQRAAVVRGRVLGTDGAPMGGVTATVVGHPELGSMTTNSDGQVYLAVNGGGTLRIRYTRYGYLPVERDVDVPWQDYVWVDDVRLTALDSRVTDVDLSSPLSTAQIARGSSETDDSGTRQATLLFAAGTSASMTLPGGTQMLLDHLGVRATEYTVGEHGAEAMPAPLPPSSTYTYAVDYTVDEAVQAGATQVTFSKPVIAYTDNFIGFDTGTRTPAGYYDQAEGAWVPVPDGRVIEIVSETNGVADIDANGDGDPDSIEELTQLGVTSDERHQVADLYQPGDTVWRVPITHFTPYDFNYSSRFFPGSRPPNVAPSTGFGGPGASSCESGGSLIACDDQVLGEDVGVAGTDAGLHYRSDRVPGRAVGNTIELQVTPADPGNLRRARVRIDVAGQQIVREFDSTPGQVYRYTWNGRDAFGRTVTGAVTANVTLDYIYPTRFAIPVPVGERSFGQSAGADTGIPTRDEDWMRETFSAKIGADDVSPTDLGGWTIDGHNRYDPTARTLHLGDGSQVSAEQLTSPITRVAGHPDGGGATFRASVAEDTGDIGDGGPANDATFDNLGGGAIGADGSVYVADTGHHRVRRIAPDGIITTVAGGGDAPEDGHDAGDGGSATDAYLWSPDDVATGPDGSLYIADGVRVRRVTPDGTITTIAGTGEDAEPAGDGGPATDAVLSTISAIAIAAEGTLYITDFDHHQVRRIGPDGVISLFAGTGVRGFSGDGGPATEAELNFPQGLAVRADGSVFVADTTNHRVRRISPDGTISTFAGTGELGTDGDGRPADQAQLIYPRGVTAAPDGAIYISENRDVRRVDASGVISTFAGGGGADPGAGGAATGADVSCPRSVMAGPGGSTYLTDPCDESVYRVAPALPGAGLEDYRIPSPDGDEIYIFDRHGRHLQTLSTTTGAMIAEFSYDVAGRLTAMTDGDGNTTHIERGADGSPAAIVAPFGQRTLLSLDDHGWLSGIEDPSGRTTSMTSTSGGLLKSMQSPKGAASHFDYDDLGYLIRDADAVGGAKELARTPHDGGANVVMTTAGGHAQAYAITRGLDGVTRRGYTSPSGLGGSTVKGTDAIIATSLPDGTSLSSARTADPRFGLAVPLVAGSVRTPGGIRYNVDSARDVELASEDNPLSLESMDDTATINGRVWGVHFDAGTRETTTTSPEGRTTSSTGDAQGRPLSLSTPGILPVTSTYDARGRLSTATQGDRTTAYSYDDHGLLSHVDGPLNQDTSYVYDAAGHVVSETLPGGRTVGYTYDADGGVTAVTPPGRPAYTFTTNAIDLPETASGPDVGDGATTARFHYNEDRQITSVDRPDGTTLTYRYNSGGRLSSLESADDSITYHYNSATGQVTSIEAPSGEDLTFGYDGGLTMRNTLSGEIAGTVTRTFTNDLRVAQVTVTGGASVDYGYDEDGLLTRAGGLTVSRALSNGAVSGTSVGAVTSSLGWSNLGELESSTASASGNALLASSYTRDALGRVVGETESGPSGTTAHYDYTYDAAGRLSDVTRDGDTVAHYTYDANGNRTSVETDAGTRTAQYDDQDRLISDGATDYTYNKNGQLESKIDDGDTTAYHYDAFGALSRVNLPDGRTVEYVLDGQTRRVGKKVDGALVQGFLYGEGLNPIAELTPDGGIRSVFVYGADGTTPSLMIRDGHTYRFITDERSSPRLVIDTSTGAVVQRLEYDSYGNVTLDTNPAFQPFGFEGGVYDTDTGLTRFGQRDYDASTGRFTSKDPEGFSGGDTNLYSFALDDPINRGDVTGDGIFGDAFSALGNLAGDTVGAVASVGNTAAAAGNALPNVAAGTLDGLTGGLSTQIAGHVFGFDPSCADFGTAGRIGAGIAFAANMLTGEGELMIAAKAERGLPWAGYRPYAPSRDLPRYPGGRPKPESPYPHTQLGTRKGQYPQSRELDGAGRPVRDIDWTDHGRPDLHTDPHQHVYSADGSRGRPASVWP